MKKYVTLFLLTLAMLVPLYAQVDKQNLYQHKVEVYTKMKNAGWTMTGFGGGLIITGTILVATLPGGYWYDYDDTYYSSDNSEPGDDVKAFAGILSIGLGVGLLAGGITLGSIGTHKVRQYQSKLNGLSLNPIITPDVQGLSLVYRF
jgi:hypothetical protein